jgi:hypothetical protein
MISQKHKLLSHKIKGNFSMCSPPVKSNCKFTALKIADAVWRPNLGLKTRKTLALFAQEKQKKKENHKF